MSHSLGFVFFALSFFAIYGGFHWFVYDRVARTLLTGKGAKRFVAILFAILCFISIFGVFNIELHNSAPLYHIGSVWFGIIAIWFTIFLCVTLLAPLMRDNERHLTWIGIVAMLIISGWSIYNGSRPPAVRELSGIMPRMKPEMHNFTIAFLPDMHLTRFTPPDDVKEMVAKVNRYRPHLIIIGGDLIDDSMEAMSPQVAELAGLKAKMAIIGILGNHEYYAGLESFYGIASAIGMTTLKNEVITLPNGLQIIAVDDPEGKSYADIKTIVRKLGRDMDIRKPSVMLSHRQEAFEFAAKLDVGLTLAGHTHGGQIPPLDMIIALFGKYPMGVHKEGFSTLYTSYGVSTWGPPMRFLNHNEIMIIKLKSDILGREQQL